MENFNNVTSVSQKPSHKRLIIFSSILVVLLGGVMVSGYLYPQKHDVQVGKEAIAPEDSIAIPDSQLKAMQDIYSIDMNGAVKVPGGVIVPQKNITLKGGIETCMKTDNVDLKFACANKYSIEQKDSSLCKSILSNIENGSELQNSCLYNYFESYPDIKICYGMNKSTTDKNIYYFTDSCFQETAYSNKDPKLCPLIVSNSQRSLCEQATK